MRRRTIQKVKEKEIENHSLLFFATPSSDALLILNEGRMLTVESNPADWLNVTVDNPRNGIIVICNQNPSTDQRNGVIVVSDAVKEYRISVSQYGVVTVIPDILSFSSDSSSQTFQILGGCGSFTITPGSSWISISGTGRNRTLTVEANQSAERSTNVTIRDINTSEIVTLIIVQEKVEYTPMSVIPNILTFGKPIETQSATLYGGEGNYSFALSDLWFSYRFENNVLYITVETNPAIKREGTITITDGTGASISIFVIQEGMPIREWVHGGNEYYQGLTILSDSDVRVVSDYNYHLGNHTTSINPIYSTSHGILSNSNSIGLSIYTKDGVLLTNENVTLNTSKTQVMVGFLIADRTEVSGYDHIYTYRYASNDPSHCSIQLESNQTISLSTLYSFLTSPHGFIYCRLILDDKIDPTLSYGINFLIRNGVLEIDNWIDGADYRYQLYLQSNCSLTRSSTSGTIYVPSAYYRVAYLVQYRGTSSVGGMVTVNIPDNSCYPDRVITYVSYNGGFVNGNYSNGAFSVTQIGTDMFTIRFNQAGTIEGSIAITWTDNITDHIWLSSISVSN